MSDEWIKGSNRLIRAVGQEKADEILDKGYEKYLVRVMPDGTIKIKVLE